MLLLALGGTEKMSRYEQVVYRGGDELIAHVEKGGEASDMVGARHDRRCGIEDETEERGFWTDVLSQNSCWVHAGSVTARNLISDYARQFCSIV